MDLEKVLKMIENGNNHLLIPMTTKATPLQFLATSDAAKKKGEDVSTYIRNAVCMRLDHDNLLVDHPNALIAKQQAKDRRLSDQSDDKAGVVCEKSQFTLKALKKYILSESLSMPTDNEIIKHWPEGAMSKNNIDFMIDALKKYIVASKRKIPTESELVILWVEGKTVPAPFFRRREILAPEELPEWLADKFKTVS